MSGPDGPSLALVESNTTGSGREFCAVARARGLRPVVLTAAPDRYRYLDEDRVDRQVLDTGEIGAVLGACERLAKSDGLAGVTSSSEYFSASAAEAAARLGLPGPDPAALVRCRQKDRQRGALAAAGVPIPSYRPVGDEAEAVRAASEIGYPVVVKPTTGSGSVGVRLCPNATTVAEHAAALLSTAENERGLPVPRVVLVEQYVVGAEFSVETFDQTVVGVVAKHLGPAPFFVEIGHDFPAPVRPKLAGALGEVARAAIAALGLGWGAAHTELRVTPDGPVVIEVNPRLAGGMIPSLVRLAGGADLVDAVVARASGHDPSPAPRPRSHASIRFVVADRPGTIAAIRGLNRARSAAGLVAAEITVGVGDQVAISHSFRDRVGYAIAIGQDAASAAGRAGRAAAHLHVVMG